MWAANCQPAKSDGTWPPDSKYHRQVLTSWTEPGKRSGEKGELAEGSVLVAGLPQHSWPSLLQLLVNASPKPPQDRGSDVPC